MAAGLVVLGPSAPAPAAEGARVLMVDNEPDLTRWHYDPAELTVPAGTTVVWLNKGKEDHTVTADDKSFDSGMKRTGGTFERVFPQAGRYAYHCAPHPWMKGTVRVVATATAAGTAAGTDPAAPPASTTATTSAPTASSLPSSLAPTPRSAAGVTTTSTIPAATPAPTTPPAPEDNDDDGPGDDGGGSGRRLPEEGLRGRPGGDAGRRAAAHPGRAGHRGQAPAVEAAQSSRARVAHPGRSLANLSRLDKGDPREAFRCGPGPPGAPGDRVHLGRRGSGLRRLHHHRHDDIRSHLRERRDVEHRPGRARLPGPHRRPPADHRAGPYEGRRGPTRRFRPATAACGRAAPGRSSTGFQPAPATSS